MGLIVTISDLEEQWRPIPDDQKAKATALIARAVAVLRVQIPSLDRRVDESGDLMLVAKGVVIDMIKRALPSDGDDAGGGEITQHLRVAGPFTDQRLFKTASKNLYVLDQEISLLSGRRSPKVGTITTPPARR